VKIANVADLPGAGLVLALDLLSFLPDYGNVSIFQMIERS
jgi:hypothetical protein